MLKTSNAKFHLRSQPSPLKSFFLFGQVLPLKCFFSQGPPPPPHFITLSFTSAHCSYAVFPQPQLLLSFPLSLIMLLSFDNSHPSPPSPFPSPPIKAHLACIRLQSVNSLVHIRYPPQFRI